MDTWVVLLRGVNVGGGRPVPMADLRDALAGMGFVDPVTYINSGNAIVGSRRAKTSRTVPTIERRLTETFGHEVRVVIRNRDELSAIVAGIPADWDPDDGATRYNVMYLVDGVEPQAVLETVRPKPGLESVSSGPHVLYWSAPFASLTRTAMVRLSAHPAYQQMTVRNLRTTLKVHALMRSHPSVE